MFIGSKGDFLWLRSCILICLFVSRSRAYVSGRCSFWTNSTFSSSTPARRSSHSGQASPTLRLVQFYKGFTLRRLKRYFISRFQLSLNVIKSAINKTLLCTNVRNQYFIVNFICVWRWFNLNIITRCRSSSSTTWRRRRWRPSTTTRPKSFWSYSKSFATFLGTQILEMTVKEIR